MVIILVLILIILTIFLYIRLPKFGRTPRGKRLERMQKSPNFKDGKFQNISFTPSITEGYSMSGVLYKFLIKKFPRTKPAVKLPSVKTDLKSLDLSKDLLVWFGHSSYYFQLKGKRFLVDPVFSGNASPIPFSNRSFAGSDIYTPSDMPEIDFLLITHDHYDHLDYPTTRQLRPKVRQVICGLGVGSHFKRWGFDPKGVKELDWHEQLPLADDITLFTAPARHFSGRGFARNNTLWLSFIIKTPNFKLYLGGDSGYDSHFAQIGEDLADLTWLF